MAVEHREVHKTSEMDSSDPKMPKYKNPTHLQCLNVVGCTFDERGNLCEGVGTRTCC